MTQKKPDGSNRPVFIFQVSEKILSTYFGALLCSLIRALRVKLPETKEPCLAPDRKIWSNDQGDRNGLMLQYLQMSELIVYPKHPVLQQVVEFFWTLEGTPSSTDDSTLIYPEGCFEILLSFASATRWISDDHRLDFSGSIFSPIRTCHYDVHPAGKVEYLAIRFKSHSLPLITDPLHLFSNRACDLQEILDRRLWQRLQPVFDLPDMKSRLEFLENTLTQWLLQGMPQRPPAFQYAVNLLHQSRGSLPIQAICENTGLYPRKLERQFQQYLGVTPKTYARILRFNHIMQTLMLPRPSSTMEAVFQAGYADQAHFIRECRQFTGRTPGELFA